MLILTATTDKLQVISDATCTIDVHVSWMEYDGTTVTPGRTNTAITTATTTDILAAPASSKQRNAKTINIRNKHATASLNVTVQFNQNSTLYELHKVTLFAGDVLQYVEGIGWFTLTRALPTQILLAADQSNATTTPTEVTGLTVATEVGTYLFRYNIIYQSSAAGTGVKYSVDYTGTVTSFVANRRFIDASATQATAAPDQDSVVAGATLMAGFAARAKSQAGWGTTISVDTVNLDMYEIIEGVAVVTVAGNIALWHGSETAASTTTKAGTSLILSKMG